MLGEGREEGEREETKGSGREEEGERKGERRDFDLFNVLREPVAISNFIKHWSLITIVFYNVLCDQRGGVQSPCRKQSMMTMLRGCGHMVVCAVSSTRLLPLFLLE